MKKVSKLASSFVDDELISIELEDGGKFKVQRAALCHASEYFRKALSGEFQETSSKKLNIPGCSTESFEQILYWIFSHEVLKWDLDPEGNPTPAMAQSAQLRLTKLWLTSDMLLMACLQNEAMRQLRSFLSEDTVSVDAVSWAFEFAAHDSPLVRTMMQEVSRDFFSKTAYLYSADELDALGSIPGFVKALLHTGQRVKIDDHFHVKVPVEREKDSAFEVKPPAKDN